MGFRSPIQEVERFLKLMHDTLSAPCFDIDRDLILIQKSKSPEEVGFSTPYTLIDLDFDFEDVAETLLHLRLCDYTETLFDRNDEQPPLLFVFGPVLRGKTVYVKVKVKVKVKVREQGRACVLCVSFHYAQYPMGHPYA